MRISLEPDPIQGRGPGRDCMRMRQNSQKTWNKKCLVDKKYNGSFKSTIVLRFSYLYALESLDSSPEAVIGVERWRSLLSTPT